MFCKTYMAVLVMALLAFMIAPIQADAATTDVGLEVDLVDPFYSAYFVDTDYTWLPRTWIDLQFNFDPSTVTTTDNFDEVSGDYWSITAVQGSSAATGLTFDAPERFLYNGISYHYIYVMYDGLASTTDIDFKVVITDSGGDTQTVTATVSVGSTKTTPDPATGNPTTQVADLECEIFPWVYDFDADPYYTYVDLATYEWNGDPIEIFFSFTQDTDDAPVDLAANAFTDTADGSYWTITATQGSANVTSEIEFDYAYRELEVDGSNTTASHWILMSYDSLSGTGDLTFKVQVVDRATSPDTSAATTTLAVK